MFKAMLEMSIRKSVIRPDGTRVARVVHIVKKEVELPFVPVKGCLFYDFGDELQVEWVHYDLQDQRFDIDCGGMLADSEDRIPELLHYLLARSWALRTTVVDPPGQVSTDTAD